MLPRLSCLLAFAIAGPSVLADDTVYEAGGHVKGRLNAETYPAASLMRGLTGSTASSLESELRLNFSVDNGPWTLDTAWQLYAGYGDRFELLRILGGGPISAAGHLQNDDRRLMNLTDDLRDDGRTVALHRLDRLAIGYTKDNFVLKLGRQAISWGNGLMFSPLDIVNPFDPTAVDTEYKTGDDMLYGQLLRENGDDIQFAHVFRRNPVSGDVAPEVATTAFKYHGVLGEAEYDLLLARHYDATTIGIGGNRGIGGAILRGDVVYSHGEFADSVQLVTSLSYSWVWGGRNMSGIVEYFFAEFGLHNGSYDAAAIADRPELLARLNRGEAFTLGRNYLAGGVTVEMTPLWLLTPNLFVNLDDGSALFQGVTRVSLGDNSEFLGALSIPLGPDGAEFGGIPAGANTYLSTDAAVFAQIAWYF